MRRSLALPELRSLLPPSVLLVSGLLLAGCSILGKQVAVSAVNSCIEKQCSDEQGKARQQCTTSCQGQYGR